MGTLDFFEFSVESLLATHIRIFYISTRFSFHCPAGIQKEQSPDFSHNSTLMKVGDTKLQDH